MIYICPNDIRWYRGLLHMMVGPGPLWILGDRLRCHLENYWFGESTLHWFAVSRGLTKGGQQRMKVFARFLLSWRPVRLTGASPLQMCTPEKRRSKPSLSGNSLPAVGWSGATCLYSCWSTLFKTDLKTLVCSISF